MMVAYDIGKEDEGVDLSTALQEAIIEKDNKSFCTVYLKGRPNKNNILGNPKVIGIHYEGLTDYEIIEIAVLSFNNRVSYQ